MASHSEPAIGRAVRIPLDATSGALHKRQRFIRVARKEGRKISIQFLLPSYSQLIDRLLIAVFSPLHIAGSERTLLSFQKRKLESCTECSVALVHSGVYRFEIYPNGCDETKPTEEFVSSLQIHPTLQPPSGKSLALEEFCFLTFVPKWMLSARQDWAGYFEKASESGFNVVHLAPFQKRGTSDSPFSIANQLEVAAEAGGTIADVAAAIQEGRTAFGLSFITDVVWNHTSSDSQWLLERPECGYNLQNSPHLVPAFLMDQALMDFSDSLTGTKFESTHQIHQLMRVFEADFLEPLRLWEFFCVDVEDAVAVAQKSEFSGEQSIASYSEESFEREFLSLTYSKGRFPLSVAVDRLAKIFAEPRGSLRSVLFAINDRAIARYQDKISRAIENVTARIAYERLALHGPLLGEISAARPLVASYFTRFISQKSGRLEALANNGWIWCGNPRINFANPESDAYFVRDVIVWGDCVKLRYGESYADNPWLWDYMTEYTVGLALLFDGFRIDNCHSTPIPVAVHLLTAARRKNPELLVVAELFTGSEAVDLEFTKELGIDCLVRESLINGTTQEFCNEAYQRDGFPIGSLDRETINETQNSVPGSLLMDCTHDNRVPREFRTAQDSLANAAIVAFSVCPIGSTYGYDYLPAQQRNLVLEKRPYDFQGSQVLAPARRLLNELHQRLATEGYCEFYTTAVHETLVQMIRERPLDHSGYVLVAFPQYSPSQQTTVVNLDLSFPGFDCSLVYCCSIEKSGTEFSLSHPNASVSGDSCSVANFTAGSILILKKRLAETGAVDAIEAFLLPLKIAGLFSGCSLCEMNVFLYRHSAEEQSSIGQSAYCIPDFGELFYCGLQGFVTVIEKNSPLDMSHPLFKNIRSGNWIMEYICDRLCRYQSQLSPLFSRLSPVEEEMRKIFAEIRKLPFYYHPLYLCKVITAVYDAAVLHCLDLMGVKNEDFWYKRLAMTSVQLIGYVPSASLSESFSACSLAAGLPHFATHHMRCWGRDCFISFQGLFLITNRFDEARSHLLAFASCYRGGLIPNLLDESKYPRYNSRDSVWWFLRAITQYCDARGDLDFLKESVLMRFPDGKIVEPRDPLAYSTTKSVAEIVVDCLKRHWEGILLPECYAEKDFVMKEEGKVISTFVERLTGFLMGGNEFNCGTWMDKMGESSIAGNRSVPATPRSGAPIEVVALSHLVLRWVVFNREFFDRSLGKEENAGSPDLSFAVEWLAILEASFDSKFFLPDLSYYADYLCSEPDFRSFQIRPNVLVAMAVSPALFAAQKAIAALEVAQKFLVGPLGVKTLCPLDSQYRGNYSMSSDDCDHSTASGFNYHQGPEWLWLMGCFLLATLHFEPGKEEFVRRSLDPLLMQLSTSDACGLPELTNENGARCLFGCSTQAWSNALILEVMVALRGERVKSKEA